MDIITQRLIVFRKKILAELRRLSDTVKEHEKAETESNKSEKEQQCPPAVSSALDAIQSIAKSQKTAHDPKKWYKDRTFLVSLAGVIVVAGYTGVTYRMWRDANRNFVVNERAWIGVDRPVSITQISTDDKSVTSATYVVTIKNYGPSVARRVEVVSDIAIGTGEVVRTINKSCKDAEAATLRQYLGSSGMKNGDKPEDVMSPFGDIVFPTATEGHWFNRPLPRNAVTLIAGCVTYVDEFGKLRHTKFTNWMVGDVSKTKLPALLYSFIGGNDAD